MHVWYKCPHCGDEDQDVRISLADENPGVVGDQTCDQCKTVIKQEWFDNDPDFQKKMWERINDRDNE